MLWQLRSEFISPESGPSRPDQYGIDSHSPPSAVSRALAGHTPTKIGAHFTHIKREVSLILLLLTEALLSCEHMLPEAEVNRHRTATRTTEAHSYALENGEGWGGAGSTAAADSVTDLRGFALVISLIFNFRGRLSVKRGCRGQLQSRADVMSSVCWWSGQQPRETGGSEFLDSLSLHPLGNLLGTGQGSSPVPLEVARGS